MRASLLCRMPQGWVAGADIMTLSSACRTSSDRLGMLPGGLCRALCGSVQSCHVRHVLIVKKPFLVLGACFILSQGKC